MNVVSSLSNPPKACDPPPARCGSVRSGATNVLHGTLYNNASYSQDHAHAAMFEALDLALSNLQQLPAEVIEMSDLGCNAGASIVRYGNRIFDSLRNQHSDKRPINYTVTDLPSNDWAALMAAVSLLSARCLAVDMSPPQ